jgi:diaminopimelate epimerase
MNILFSKMHSIGNDFVIIDGVTQTVSLSAKNIRVLGNRHLGIGFDQLLLIEKPRAEFCDFFYRIFNQDGSEAEQCGNGVRCCAQFIWDKKLSQKKVLAMRNKKGLTVLQKQGDLVSADMGLPSFQPNAVPFIADVTAVTYPIFIDHKTYHLSVLSMGNPHAVLVVKNIDLAPVKTVGAALQKHANFPQKVNVGFLEIVDRQAVRLRVFERGAGETLACGSGACAAVVSGIRLGLLDQTVSVKMPLGVLSVTWLGLNMSVILTGSVTMSFTGKIDLL